MSINLSSKAPDIEIWTEGKTDWKIIKKACEKLGLNLHLGFHEFEGGERGDSKLLQNLRTFAETPNHIPILFIFDHDVENIIREVNDPVVGFKNWGNNIYSFSIPIPNRRKGLKSSCIELYFSDDDIKTLDSDGRRLFLTNEFSPKSGKHNLDISINLGSKGILNHCSEENIKIIDSDVWNKESKSIALSKADFANNIFNDVEPFNKFSFDDFRVIFEIIEKVVLYSAPTCTICFPDQEDLFAKIRGSTSSDQYDQLFVMFTSVLEVSLLLFITTTMRVYENIIVNESEKHIKKVKAIKEILRNDFLQLNLLTLQELAEKCTYLVDSTAPKDLKNMKLCLEKAVQLDDIGQVIDDLEKLYPPEPGTATIVNKPQVKKEVLKYIVSEFAKYDSVSGGNLRKKVAEAGIPPVLVLSKWENALKMLLSLLEPLYSGTFILRELEQVDTSSNTYTVRETTYQDKSKYISTLTITAEEVEKYQSVNSELVLSEGTKIRLFPFALIKDDSLFLYKNTRASGYEYHSPKNSNAFVFVTKKKFNHSVFRTGSTQELFWTEAPPIKNPVNNVKANVPSEGNFKFVGRESQKNSIYEEIIEIPNQNGIIYGQGGIGKTALLIHVSKKLFDETNQENVLFDNIIWVSAKSDYYDYIFDSVEHRKPQFSSLDTILSTVLEFFGYENSEEYDFEDKKSIALEIFEQNRVLLVLDNLETILSTEAEKIIKFFEVEVKRKLRAKPQNFKVIISSRKEIHSGFHQMELKGLDISESRQLIDNLYQRYSSVKPELTVDQKDKLHEATKGIPIVIKHCVARIYEYNVPIRQVISDLPQFDSELVKFSFKEILQELENNDHEKIHLQILLLLGDVNRPLMVRQISDVLVKNIVAVENALPLLIDYQCLKKVNEDSHEKYYINPEIRLLTASLAIAHTDIVRDIRQKLDTNFSFDRQIDYSPDENLIAETFNSYLENGVVLEAEQFIINQLKNKPESIHLKYVYAKYLSEQKGDVLKAIEILEPIVERSGNNRVILRLLFSSYIRSEITNFEKVNVYANQLEVEIGDEEEFKIKLAEFLIKWSTSILKIPSKLDPLEEMSRNAKFRDLAKRGLKILESIQKREPSTYYLLSQGYYNISDYESALEKINTAIKLSRKLTGDYPQSFSDYREIVLRKWENKR